MQRLFDRAGRLSVGVAWHELESAPMDAAPGRRLVGADAMRRPWGPTLGLVLLGASAAFAQPTPSGAARATRHPEEGRPFVRRYAPAEVGGNSQVWAIVQDPRGVIYAGCNNGILEFDGATWRRIKVGLSQSVRSLTLDPSGRIYVGGEGGAFGYLAPDGHGDLQFVSLADRLPEAERTSTCTGCSPPTDGVFFQAEEAVFRWAHERLTTIKPVSRFNRASLIDGRIYLTMPESGLNVLEGETFRALPGTERLGREPYPVLLRYDDRRLLVGTRTRWSLPLRRRHPHSLPDAHRRPLQGLPALPGRDPRRLYLRPDHDVRRPGHHRSPGPARDPGEPVERAAFRRRLLRDAGPGRAPCGWGSTRASPGSRCRPRSRSSTRTTGCPASLRTSPAIDGRLYLAGQTGVSYLDRPSPGSTTPRFRPLGTNRSQCWFFTHDARRRPDPARRPDRRVLRGALRDRRHGLARHSRRLGRHVPRVDVLGDPRIDPTRLWVGLFDGMSSFRHVEGRWTDEGRVPGVADQVRTLFENPDGSVWAGTASTGDLALLVRLPPRPGEAPPSAHRRALRRGRRLAAGRRLRRRRPGDALVLRGNRRAVRGPFRRAHAEGSSGTRRSAACPSIP